MSERIHATGVIARRRLFESLIGPGYYIVLSISLLVAYLLISGFRTIVDTSGLNYALHPIYDLVGRTLEGGLGRPFLGRLFSEGPFVLTLYVAVLPVFLYLALTSIFRFCVERSVGAVELVVYGPADGTAYFLAGFIKDLVLGVAAVALVLLFFALAAVSGNLYLGPAVARSVLLVIPLMTAGFAYAVLAAVLTDNVAASITVFLAVNLLFGLIMTGTFLMVEGYARNLATVLGWLLQWVSPFYYWTLGLTAAGSANGGLFVLALGLLLILTVALLYASHRILTARGVRA